MLDAWKPAPQPVFSTISRARLAGSSSYSANSMELVARPEESVRNVVI